MKKHENIRDLFVSELQDVYNAEEQIVKALPTVIKAVECEDLREAFENHLEETKGQVERLNEIFSLIEEKQGKKTCKAMKGLIDECSEAIDEFPKSSLRDAAIIAKAQRIEHYEIAAYGTLRTFAKQLELKEVVKLLKETLDEEGNADKSLTKIAEGGLLSCGVNQKADGCCE